MAVADGLDRYLYGLGKPAGHPQVAKWMRRHFDDRLLVRQVLLGSTEDGGDMTMEELQSEGSLGSELINSASWRSNAFDAPDEPTGVTLAGRPRNDRGTEPEASTPDHGAELDAAIEQMRSRGSWVRLLLLLVLLGAVAAGALLLLQGCGLLGEGGTGFPPEQVGTDVARRAAHVGGVLQPGDAGDRNLRQGGHASPRPDPFDPLISVPPFSELAGGSLRSHESWTLSDSGSGRTSSESVRGGLRGATARRFGKDRGTTGGSAPSPPGPPAS